jgi:hypothetical protein
MTLKIKLKIFAAIFACVPAFQGCADYLDLVPDNVPTIEMAFHQRLEAERYLYSCYAYLPVVGSPYEDPAQTVDELWRYSFRKEDAPYRMAIGYQNANAPILDNFAHSYQGIRYCNTFLENVSRATDLPDWERKVWEGEALFLKAYFHFRLVQMYGPVPIVKENLPANVEAEQVRVARNTVDECFDYIVEVLDDAIAHLPLETPSLLENQGRVTKSTAAALKAKVLVTAASPLYNGNTQFAMMKNRDGKALFDAEKKTSKWEKAVVACREAIDICHESGIELYYTDPREADVPDTIKTQLNIRNAVTRKWNSETIWAYTLQGGVGVDQLDLVRNLDPRFPDADIFSSYRQPALRMAELFYTSHGVPIAEDIDWQGKKIDDLRTGTDAEIFYIKKNYTTIQLHFDREPRFYASLGFDGGVWFGQGQEGSDPSKYFTVACRQGQPQRKTQPQYGPITGYFAKKLVAVESEQIATRTYSLVPYPFPIIRLADVYLLYAEAINEAEGPAGANSADMFKYIDEVRKRAGLQGVKDSWNNYTANTKYTGQAGMRDIIHQERTVELLFESQRFWDLRRWMEVNDYRSMVQGWDVYSSFPADFYTRVNLYQLKFSLKDYFWPISINELDINPNLVQSLGW